MSILQQALKPFTLKGFYLLTWGTALGANVWNTVSGLRAFRTLPRQTFGLLQSRLQPLYFGTSSALLSTLLVTHLYFHPGLLGAPGARPHWHEAEEGVQALLVVAALVPSLANWLVVGPAATKTMFERHRLERLEGKEYDAPAPSEPMAKLNRRFSALHGAASALNLLSGLALAGLGLAVSL
ncbi:hypothetical protein Q5752_004080 [Cryptotrichosporon argae]